MLHKHFKPLSAQVGVLKRGRGTAQNFSQMITKIGKVKKYKGKRKMRSGKKKLFSQLIFLIKLFAEFVATLEHSVVVFI